jgi:hypothetical protein
MIVGLSMYQDETNDIVRHIENELILKVNELQSIQMPLDIMRSKIEGFL